MTTFHDREERFELGTDAIQEWGLIKQLCPACNKFVFSLGKIERWQTGDFHTMENLRFVQPKATNRPGPSPDVPECYAEDYAEACLVLSDSPKASAALSRRCLQNILRGVAKVKKSNLAEEIQQVIDSNTIPTHLSESIDAIRQIGNFAAHPIKSKTTGEIVPIEEGEAEWLLDVLEGLFDFYFIQPARTKRKREALNAKLKAAGKEAMK